MSQVHSQDPYERIERLRVATVGSFLPVIQRPIDNTAMQSYMTCPREYYFSMLSHRRGEGKSPPLVFGSAWHKGLEVLYKSGGDLDLAEFAVQDSWEGHNDPSDYRTLPRVIMDLRKYARERKDYKNTVGFVEGVPMVELAANSMSRGLIHPWAGKLDRLVDESGLIYVEDHKTTSRFDKNYWRQYALSNQMKGYTYLGQELLPSEAVVGARINLSHVLTNKTEFHTHIFTYTKSDIDEWIKVTNSQFRRLGRDIELYLKLVEEAGGESWDIINEAFPAHYGDNGCARKFGMCAYDAVCGMSQKLRGKILEKDFPINPWNPLESEDE